MDKVLVAAPNYQIFNYWVRHCQNELRPNDVRFVTREQDFYGYHKKRLIIINFNGIDLRKRELIRESIYLERVVPEYKECE